MECLKVRLGFTVTSGIIKICIDNCYYSCTAGSSEYLCNNNLLVLYVGNSVSKLQIQVATYVF
jgi:hypothetical protein